MEVETSMEELVILGPWANSEAHLGLPDVPSGTTVNNRSESIEALSLLTIEEPSIHACGSDPIKNTDEVSVPSDTVLTSAEVKSAVTSFGGEDS